MEAFVRLTGARLDVVAPVPYFPRLPIRTQWDEFSQIEGEEIIGQIKVYHPRYLVVPKLGMSTHGRTLFWATFELVRRLHIENNYDLIDAHWIYPDGWAATEIGRRLRIPVVLSARGDDITVYPDIPRIKPIIATALRNCDKIISVSQALKTLLVRIGISESKITVIGNGVDLQRFCRISKEQARGKLRLPERHRIIVSVGRLDPAKGHDILVEMLDIMRNRGAELPYLYILGTGSYECKIRQLIQRQNLEQFVTLVGEILNKELIHWYNAADLLCLASDREGWPNVLLESMACGTPVVATDVFGVPEVITSETVGLLVKQRTASAFARQVSVALQKNWNRDDISSYASQHSWENVGAVVQETFREVLQRKRKQKEVVPKGPRDESTSTFMSIT